MLRKSTDPKSGKVRFDPLTATVEDGLAYVELTTGQVYAIRIFNKAVDHDVAVKVLIDGVSAFSFSQDEFLKSTNLFVIDRGKSGVLRGWHDTGSKFLEFVVSDEAAAGKLGATSSSVGTVTVQFFPSWRVDEPKPKVELLTSVAEQAKERGSTPWRKWSSGTSGKLSWPPSACGTINPPPSPRRPPQRPHARPNLFDDTPIILMSIKIDGIFWTTVRFPS